MKNLKVSDYMTTSVLTERENSDIINIIKIFDEGEIRHMPIIDDNNHPIGMISQRDTKVIDNIEYASQFTAGDIMKRDPVVVWEYASLKSVAALMAIKKIGSVIVVNKTKVVIGIFTSIDALNALFDVLDDDPTESYFVEEEICLIQ